MINFFKKIFFWCYIKIHSILINISLALYRTEEDILKADPNNLQERDKRIQRKLHRNPVLEKFYAGQTDEKYVREYYELLEKADKFMRTTTSYKMAVAADKYGTNYGTKDQYGRRYEHFGFFDDKHKHAGKTIGEAILMDFEERRTKDDDLELLQIFDNKPIETGFSKVLDVIEKTERENVNFEYEIVDMFRKSKKFIFPIKIIRKNENAVNKIEQLTETLHIKKIGFEHRQLEFFIPLKFKTSDCDENSVIFKELTDINQVYIKNEYGKLLGFNIIKYLKRIKHNETHDVIKFHAIEMKMMGFH